MIRILGKGSNLILSKATLVSFYITLYFDPHQSSLPNVIRKKRILNNENPLKSQKLVGARRFELPTP